MVKTVNASALTCSMKGVGIAAGTIAALIPLSAFFLTKADDPSTFIAFVPKLITVLASILGGIICAKGRSARPILSAVICGAILFTVITAISLMAGGSILSIPVGLLCSFVPSVIGGFIGIPKEKSAGAKRREMMKKLNR